jgi:hypothetical protein
MVDIKVVDILKTMYQEERNKLGMDNTNINYTHGDKAEALNNAIFMYENKDEFIDKDILRDMKVDLETELKVFQQGNIKLTEQRKYELGAELSLISKLLKEDWGDK